MKITREQAGLGVLLVLLSFAIAMYLGRHSPGPEDVVVAHERSTVAAAVAAKAETVYVAARASSDSARARYVLQRDTVLRFLTDTVRVKEFIAHVDTVLHLDSIALAKADTALHLERAAGDSVRHELAIVLSHGDPRLTVVATGLYDPIAQTPAVSGTVGVRVFRSFRLVATTVQRFALHESPRVYVGASVTFQ